MMLFLGIAIGVIIGAFISNQMKKNGYKWISCREKLPDEDVAIMVKGYWTRDKSFPAIRKGNRWIYTNSLVDVISTNDSWRLL